MTIHLILGWIRKIFLYKMSYIPEPYSHSKKKYANAIQAIDTSNSV